MICEFQTSDFLLYAVFSYDIIILYKMYVQTKTAAMLGSKRMEATTYYYYTYYKQVLTNQGKFSENLFIICV